MRHEALSNHIKGSFLKEQYLEAFLVQSAYIQSLLKVFANVSFFMETKATAGSATALAVAKRIERYSFGELVDFLLDSKLIDEDLRDSFYQYRKQKSKVMQDLLKNIKREDLDKELKAVCEKGTTLVENKKIKEIAELVESLDKESAQNRPGAPQAASVQSAGSRS